MGTVSACSSLIVHPADTSVGITRFGLLPNLRTASSSGVKLPRTTSRRMDDPTLSTAESSSCTSSSSSSDDEASSEATLASVTALTTRLVALSASTSAPAFSKAWTADAVPSLAAQCKAVANDDPFQDSRQSTIAPALIRIWMASVWPPAAAVFKGVRPQRAAALTSAPWRLSTSIQRACPFEAAYKRGAYPSSSRLFGSAP